MQCGRLAGAGRAAHEEETVRFRDALHQIVVVVRREAHCVQWQWLTGSEDTHHYVFHATRRRDRRHTQFDVERAVFLELDLAVLWPALLGNIEVAHDLEAGDQRIAVGSRHLDVVNQRTVLAETDLCLFLARPWLDVDVGGALLVGLDNDLVDQPDQFVIGSGTNLVRTRLARLAFVQVGKQIAHGAHIGERAIKLVDRLLELGICSNAIDDLAFGENVVDDARSLDPLRVRRNDDDPLRGFLNRQPLVGFDVFAAQVLDQIHRLDAVRAERLVGHRKKFGQRLSDGPRLDLELLDQRGFQRHALAPRRTLCKVQLARGNHGTGDKIIVFGSCHRRRLLPLRQRHCESLRQARSTLLSHRRERGVCLAIDELHDTNQVARWRIDNRHDQHLFGAIAGALVDLLQESHARAVTFELHFVVNVVDIHGLLVGGNIASDALVSDRQTQILEGIQPRFDLGDDALLVLPKRRYGQAIGIEQLADILRQLQHDFVGVGCRMDFGGNCLEVLEEDQATVHVAGTGILR